MSGLRLICLALLMVLSFACNDDMPEEGSPNSERSWNPQTCTGGAEGCEVDWYVSFNLNEFPENAQILFNDKIIIDECDPQSYWSSNTTAQIKEFKISNYANLDGSQKLNMQVNKRTQNCYSKLEMHSYKSGQSYFIQSVQGEKRIVINAN